MAGAVGTDNDDDGHDDHYENGNHSDKTHDGDNDSNYYMRNSHDNKN